MSAQFFVMYRGLPVKFTYQAGKRVYEIVPRAQATPFVSEADGWFAAYQYRMEQQHVSVVSVNEVREAVAA